MKAVNPKAKTEVQWEGATFTVGMVPFGKRTEIESQVFFNREKPEGPEQLRALMQQGIDFVRWGIKGHKGLRFEDDSEAPFKANEDGSVSDETLEIYAATPGLLVFLQKSVTDFIYLKKDVVKN